MFYWVVLCCASVLLFDNMSSPRWLYSTRIRIRIRIDNEIKTREVGYRISAALTLELIEKGVKGEFTLTPSGKALKSIVCPRRRLTILKKIIEKNLAFKKILSSSQSLSRAKISDVLNKNMFEAWSKINGDTRQRRLQCLLSWFKQLNSV